MHQEFQKTTTLFWCPHKWHTQHLTFWNVWNFVIRVKKRHFRNFDYKVCHMTGNNFSNFLMKLWTTADPAVSTRASKCYYRALWSVFQKKLFKNWPHYTYFDIFCMVEISTKQSIFQEGRGWWKLFFWDRCIALFYTRTQSILQKHSLPDIFRTIKVARLFLPSTIGKWAIFNWWRAEMLSNSGLWIDY